MAAGRELWASKGSTAGTALVKDKPGSGSSWPSELTNLAGTLFFSAEEPTYGRELWRAVP